MKRVFLSLAIFAALITALCLRPVKQYASSITAAAYGLVQNAGSALTQRSTLDFTGAGVTASDDAANARTLITIPGGGTAGGTNTQTTSYTLVSGDAGKLVIMNCSSACTVTLFGSPTSTYYGSIASIGSTVATVNLNSKNFNGLSSVPVLISFQPLNFWSDGTNYFGIAPPVASTNVTFTPASNGLSFSATGGGGGGGSGSGIVTYSGPTVTLTGTTFFPIGGGASSSITETNVDVEAPAAATVQNFFVQLSAAPGVGNSVAFTWRQNAASTAITCTISGAAATTCNDTTHTVSVSQGDLLDIQAVTTGTPAALTVVMATQFGVSVGTTTRGAFASRPGCTVAGSIYYSTDVAINSECNGTSWSDWAYAYPVTLPNVVSFAWRNQGTATIATAGIISMAVAATAGDSIHGREITIPATPFTIDACFLMNFTSNNFTHSGLYVSDGTKLVTYDMEGESSPISTLTLSHWNTVTSFASASAGPTAYAPGGSFFCLRWNDNGTTATFSNTRDGLNWTQYTTESRTAFLTPTVIGWFGSSNNSGGLNVTLLSWLQH